MKKYISTIVIVLGILIFPSFSLASFVFEIGTDANTHIFQDTGGSNHYPNFTITSSTVPAPITAFTLHDIKIKRPNFNNYLKIILLKNGVNTTSTWTGATSEDGSYSVYDLSDLNIHLSPFDAYEIRAQIETTSFGSGGPVSFYATQSGTDTLANSDTWQGDFSSTGINIQFISSFGGASGSWNEDFDLNFSTTTPGFVSNTSTTADWLHEIWDSTSTSAFAIDCSVYSGGIFTSSTIGAIGCYAQKIPLGIMGMLISPLPQATNYISESFANIKNVFPFSMVFSAQSAIENQIASSSNENAGTLSFNTNTPIGSITVLTSSTLENAIGSSTKAQVFGAIEFLIWLGAGIIMITLI